jgi:hypothetical protein
MESALVRKWCVLARCGLGELAMVLPDTVLLHLYCHAPTNFVVAWSVFWFGGNGGLVQGAVGNQHVLLLAGREWHAQGGGSFACQEGSRVDGGS